MRVKKLEKGLRRYYCYIPSSVPPDSLRFLTKNSQCVPHFPTFPSFSHYLYSLFTLYIFTPLSLFYTLKISGSHHFNHFFFTTLYIFLNLRAKTKRKELDGKREYLNILWVGTVSFCVRCNHATNLVLRLLYVWSRAEVEKENKEIKMGGGVGQAVKRIPRIKFPQRHQNRTLSTSGNHLFILCLMFLFLRNLGCLILVTQVKDAIESCDWMCTCCIGVCVV